MHPLLCYDSQQPHALPAQCPHLLILSTAQSRFSMPCAVCCVGARQLLYPPLFGSQTACPSHLEATSSRTSGERPEVCRAVQKCGRNGAPPGRKRIFSLRPAVKRRQAGKFSFLRKGHTKKKRESRCPCRRQHTRSVGARVRLETETLEAGARMLLTRMTRVRAPR